MSEKMLFKKEFDVVIPKEQIGDASEDLVIPVISTGTNIYAMTKESEKALREAGLLEE